MPRLHKIDYRMFAVVLMGLVFGLLLNVTLPIFARNPLFLLVLPAGAAFFLFLVVWPKPTLILMVLARPLLDNYLELTKITMGGTQFGIGAGLNLAIIALAVFMAFYIRGFPRRHLLVRWWVVYLLVVVAATAYSPFKGQAVRLVINQLTYFSMFLIPFFVIKKEEDFRFWLKILGISFVAPVMYANIDLLVWGGKFYTDSGQRITGSFTHPNVLGFYLVLGLTLYFYILQSGFFKMNGEIKLLMYGLILNMLVLLVATKTRNAWIAGFFGFCIYGFLRDRMMLYKLLIVAVVAFASVPMIQQRIMSVIAPPKVGEYQGMNSFAWRLEMWKSSLSWIARRPLQGYGLTSFKPLSAQFSTVGKNGAHNVYLEVMFDAGILGLVTFIMIFFVPLRIFFLHMQAAKAQKESKLYAILVGYVLSYMLICTSDNLLYYLALNWYVWIFIGIMLARVRLNYAKSLKKEEAAAGQ